MKKLLYTALTLALCAALCLSGACAWLYADEDDIGSRYEVAVGVMSGLGILEGKSENADGTVNFDPVGRVTRAEAAKILAYVFLGGEQADALTCAARPFTDVPASLWSAPYIDYCKRSGMIDGLEETASGVAFCPDAGVTGRQFVKMFLGGAGYGALGELEGPDWAEETDTYIHSYDLFSGDSSLYTSPLTRREACLIAYNVMTKLGRVVYVDSYGMYMPYDVVTLSSAFAGFDSECVSRGAAVENVSYSGATGFYTVRVSGGFAFYVPAGYGGEIGSRYDIYHTLDYEVIYAHRVG